MIDAIGWAATAIFLLSYSCNDPRKLRLMQAIAALVWVGYGVLLHAVPIIVANCLVAAVAAYSGLQGLRRARQSRTLTPAAAADLSHIS
jgi:hypothetical protein